MGGMSGPGMHKSGGNLLFTIDAKSTKSNAFDDNILSDWMNEWTVGTTQSSTGFGANGDGNSRILDTNPFGATTTIWDVSDQDAASNADGGWNSSTFDIDNTKTYRFSVWVRRKTIGNGSFYLGTYGRNSAGTNVGVYNRSNGANNTNPYFSARGWWGGTNQWYLVVGHIWPVGSGTGSTHPDSGIFDTNGNLVTTVGDFVWRTDSAKSTHRTYLYYSTNTSTNQQWWNPRVEIVENAPSIAVGRNRTRAPALNKIITGKSVGRWDLTKRLRTSAVGLRKVRRTSSGFVLGGNDNDKTISVPLAENLNKLEGTIEAWIYPTAYSGSNGIFVNRDNPTANAVDWLWFGFWSSGSLLYFRLGNGSACCNNDLTIGSASTKAPINTWSHVSCTWKSGGSSYIYINGVLQGSRSISSIPNTNPSSEGRIGLGHTSGSTGSFDGKIDSFRIYDKQLTSDSILLNYNSMKSRYK